MKRLFLLLTLLSIAALARADDQTQAVQQALKDQGFYYGDVDGQGGPETDAAIRRYQIRQGLEVTGKLNAQTLAALNLGGASNGGNTIQAVPPPPSQDQSADAQPPAAPAAQDTPPPQSVVQSDHDFLRRQPQATPAPDDGDAPQPPQPQPVAPAPDEAQPPGPPEDAGQAAPSDYAKFFRKTPYETAPPVVQRSTVQRAQARLAQEGFYRGITDGEPDKATSRALADYQRYADLRVTGRLDMDTLMDMNLMPPRRVVMRPPAPYGVYGGDPDAGRNVYRGIWVH